MLARDQRTPFSDWWWTVDKLLLAAIIGLILGGVILSLVLGSLPAIREFGLGFLFTERWNPVTENFGALAPIYGTIITSLIAMVIAVPFGLGAAIFVSEFCSGKTKETLKIVIELLAA